MDMGEGMSDYMEYPDKLAELESWGEYERLSRKMYGGPTSTRLYRLLFPRRYKQLYRAYIDAQLAIQQEFLEKVLAEHSPDA